MDVDADVLVLTLTSHGSKEGLAVTNGALPLLQLGPADLRQALDESGIKWRVLVVSACYAGVFLEPLKTDTTLIVTASDAEHSSFGCEDDRDLTYFGEAFLKDALPTSVSVEEAFKKAADLVQRARPPSTSSTRTHSSSRAPRSGASWLASRRGRVASGRAQSSSSDRPPEETLRRASLAAHAAGARCGSVAPLQAIRATRVTRPPRLCPPRSLPR